MEVVQCEVQTAFHPQIFLYEEYHQWEEIGIMLLKRFSPNNKFPLSVPKLIHNS